MIRSVKILEVKSYTHVQQLYIFLTGYLSVDMNLFVAPRTNSMVNIWGLSFERMMANTWK